MRRSEVGPARPVHGPCTDGDGGWQEAIAALSRAAGRYGALLAATLVQLGLDRAPRKTAICRYWHRLNEERRES